MQSSSRRPALVAVFAVLGFLVAIAFNSTTRAAEIRPAGRSSDLVAVVREMEVERAELQERLSELRTEISLREQEAAEESGVDRSFTQEFDRVRLAAGLVALAGPGIEVTLADSKDVPQGADPNDYLIHDTDISAVVNALMVGGAEAVSVNGERVVATTPIRCAGTTILVNATRLGNPYVISAIGEADALEAALEGDPHAILLFDTYRTQFGLEVSVIRRPEVVVPEFRGSMRPAHAVAVGGGM
ncbi:MAG: DUF881 domain-containing protein [Clostridiales bacterium]|nr:DUF881 domain-containing protein [Clostridiales bacterium]